METNALRHSCSCISLSTMEYYLMKAEKSELQITLLLL